MGKMGIPGLGNNLPPDVLAFRDKLLADHAAIGKKVKKAAWYAGIGWLGLVAFQAAVLLGMFAAAVFIVLGALRVFGVI